MCRILNPISLYVQDTESYEDPREQTNSLYTSEQEGKRKRFYFDKFQNTTRPIQLSCMEHLLHLSTYLLLNTLLCNSQTPFTGRKLVFQNSKIGLETFLIEKPCFLVFHFPRKVWFSSYDVTEEQTNTNKLYYKSNSLGIQLCLFFFYKILTLDSTP